MSDEERTPLHWAAAKGDLGVVQECLDNGDNPDTADDGGWTPLISAASVGHAHVAAALIAAGCDSKKTTREGRTAFFYAVSRGHAPIIDLFIQNDAVDWRSDTVGANPIHRAICSTKTTPAILEMLKRAGGPFDVPDNEGNLPIHLACAEGRRDLIEWLVKNVSASVTEPLNFDKKAPQDLLPFDFNG
jgi:26S proteasome non-ATPase regulatory subunit 10